MSAFSSLRNRLFGEPLPETAIGMTKDEVETLWAKRHAHDDRATEDFICAYGGSATLAVDAVAGICKFFGMNDCPISVLVAVAAIDAVLIGKGIVHVIKGCKLDRLTHEAGNDTRPRSPYYRSPTPAGWEI